MAWYMTLLPIPAVNCFELSSTQLHIQPFQLRRQSKARWIHGQCHASHQISIFDDRRSGNYLPCIWDYDFLQSLPNYDMETNSKAKLGELIEYVNSLLDDEAANHLSKLEMIDDIQRLGLGDHFEKKITKVLHAINTNQINIGLGKEDYLHATALLFRLLREHRFQVHPDVLNKFRDEDGNFKPFIHCDVKGILSMYEASFLGLHNESILDDGRAFTCRYLNNLSTNAMEPNLAKQASNALELPLHWRMLRYEARCYIDLYQQQADAIPALLELAKLDFNLVQSVHQKDLAKLIGWWKDLGLRENVVFARDRLIESFLWALGVTFEPKFSNCRIAITKSIALITVIDDIYDVYGSLEELELFTWAVERWDPSALDQLPYQFKLCFLALYNTINEMGYLNLKENGIDSLEYLKNAWTGLCKVYLEETKSYHYHRVQSFDQYIDSAWKSVASFVVLIHAYVAIGENVTKENLDYLANDPNLIRWTSMIVRFLDDLATSKAELERGDVLKSVQCYMKETDCSEEVAQKHIQNLIIDTWKELNNEYLVGDCHLPQFFVKSAVNLARAAHFMYQHGDGHGAPSRNDKSRATLLLVEPIPCQALV